MLTVLTNPTPDVYVWTWTIWMTSFAVSRKWSGNSEQVFINQQNFRPTSIRKFGIVIEPRNVISMGLRQPEVPGEAIVCSDI